MSHPTEKQVVITGIGVVSPIGVGVEAFTASLMAAQSGITPVELLPFTPFPAHAAGEVKNFAAAKYAKTKEQKKGIKVMCREIQLGVVSATLALDHAGIADGQINPERLGVDFGANLMLSPPEDLASGCFACMDEQTHEFQFNRWGRQGLGEMFPLWLLKYLPNMPACHIGIAADARGPNNSITLDEASGCLVLGEAFRVIARGHADVMISGATGTRLHAVKSMHAAMWDKLAEPTDDPAKAARPFDRHRTGEVVGEGACTLIIEEAAHAAQRGAKLLGHVLGAGSSCVLGKDGKPNIRQALAQAMQAALRDAGLQPSDIGHLNANASGSPAGDLDEAAAIHDVFGHDAERVPVTAFKSYLGNSGSGCGPLEIAASLVGLQHGVVFPTLNFETPDPACCLNVVHGKPLPIANKTFLKTNVTRMGQASAVVIRGA
jgi:3-oxoacyl-[acyl-carrier-protein] synthase II